MPPEEVPRRYSHRQTLIAYEMATIGWWRDRATTDKEPNWDDVFLNKSERSSRFSSALEQRKARVEQFRKLEAAGLVRTSQTKI